MPVTPLPHSRAMSLAALVAWGAVGIPLVLDLDRTASGPALARIAAWLVFGALFFGLDRARLGRRAAVVALAAQTVAACVVAWLGRRSGLEIALLVIVVAELPEQVSRRAAIAWMFVQTALAYLPGAAAAPVARAIQAAMAVGFQVFALGAVTLALREHEARQAAQRLNQELAAAHALLADRSRLAERVRIARDLHDVLGHHLTALALNLEVARHLTTGPAAAHLATAEDVARHLLSEVRQVVRRIRAEPAPPRLGDALAALVAGIPSPRCHLTLPPALDAAIDPARAEIILRCVQEIVTNAVKHAAARNLWITIEATAAGLRVHARDDGRGAAAIEPGQGLRGMRERLEEIGGALALASRPGNGFEVTASLELAP